MKVLFVGNPATRPTDGGSASFHQALLAGLQRMRSAHECSYAMPIPGQTALPALVVEQQIDFVWFLFPYYEPVPVPFATTVWDLGHRQMPCFPELSLSGWSFDERESYYRQVLPRASLVVIGNRSGARSVSDFYQVSPDCICEIPLPIDVGSLPEVTPDPSLLLPYGLAPGEYLFYPAQFWPHKNHVTLVDTLNMLRQSGRPLKLAFCGSDKGNRSHVEGYVRQCGLSEAVVFTGFVDTPLLHQLYVNAFAMVFASLLGPDNLPPLESMALDCPVVSAAFEGAREQLGEAALLFDGLDAQDAARKILQLYDPQTRQGLIAHGRLLVGTRSSDEYCRRINQALDRFARTRRLWGPCNSYRHT